jgi:hypothetical protein
MAEVFRFHDLSPLGLAIGLREGLVSEAGSSVSPERSQAG